MNELEEIDRQLLACDFDRAGLGEIEAILERRDALLRELADQLQRSLDTGAELTRKLATYRSGLNADKRLHQYVSDDVSGDPG